MTQFDDSFHNDSSSTPGTDIFQAIVDHWKVIDTWFGEVKNLPAKVSEFEARYGRFDDQPGVQALVNGLVNARAVAGGFGDPATLRQMIAHDPNEVLSNTVPENTYAHLVWLSNQVHNVASTISATLNSLEDILGPSMGDEHDRAEMIRELFCGAAGFSASAAKSIDEIDSLVNKIAAVPASLQADMQIFSETTLVSEANQAIGRLESDIEELDKAAADAYETWTGHKQAAGVTESSPDVDEHKGYTPPWKRKKREEAKKEYQAQVQSLQAKKAQLLQKQHFIKDLSSGSHDFFMDGKKVNGATVKINANLNKLQTLLHETAERVENICSLADDEQLSSFQWVASAIDLSAQIQKWQDVSQASANFSQKSLVDF